MFDRPIRNRVLSVWFALLGVVVATGCVESTAPILFPDDTLRFTDISAGARHTCALNPQGRAYCWGFDGSGQLGTFRFDAPPATPLPVNSDERFIDISAGSRHTCALNQEGAVYCWGSAAWGVSGTPEPIGSESGFVQISSTWEHACALRDTGQVACWGEGFGGQLGIDGNRSQLEVPTTVPGLSGIVEIAAGGNSTCALDASGAAWCWGLDDTGQLGAGVLGEICEDLPFGEGTSAPCALTPIRVEAAAPYVSITAGLYHACGLTESGSIECWGDDGAAQLGIDDGAQDLCLWANGVTERPCTHVPTPVSSSRTFASLARGGAHTCAVTPAGAAYCWGADSFGQIGSIASEPGAGPETVTGGLTWRQLTGGISHTCGVAEDGAAYCWGDNQWGQLGSQTEHTVRPVLVSRPF